MPAPAAVPSPIPLAATLQTRTEIARPGQDRHREANGEPAMITKRA